MAPRSQPPADPVDAFSAHAVVVRPEARVLRRLLRPVVWVVLEDLALDAVVVDDVVVAATSSRRVAEHLRLDPATTASALRLLRDRGLIELTREHGVACRFGLSVYRVSAIAGVDVLAPRPDSPGVAASHTVETDTAPVSRPVRRRRSPSPVDGDAQGAFDLGLGTR